MFEVRVFIQGQGVDAAPFYTHCPAGGGDTHKKCVCVCNLLLVYVMLTCSGSCGSSCRSLSYSDCLVHAGEPVESEGKQQSDTSHDIFMYP